MKDGTKMFIIMFMVWVVGATISFSITCGIIWFSIWCAKHFGMF